MMHFEYDKAADAAYLYLEYPVGEGAVKETKEAGDGVFFDYDAEGRILGLEIIDASRKLAASVLRTATN